jgi:hypothetical protein
MSTYIPSNQDIISPQPPQKNSSPIWAVLVTLIILFCCCCLCLGVVATWMLRFAAQFISNLLGWIAPAVAHLASVLAAI